MTDRAANRAAEYAELIAEIRGMRQDIASVQREQAAMKQDFRDEIKALRSDLAVTSSAQNEAITNNKKKLSGLRTLCASSTGD